MRASERWSISRSRSPDDSVALGEQHIELGLVEKLTPGPSHVDATPELVELLGERADGSGARFIGVCEGPCVDPGDYSREEPWLPYLDRLANLSDAPRITLLLVEIVVRHVHQDRLPTHRTRRSDDGCVRELFEPNEGTLCRRVKRAADSHACHQSLE